MREDEKKKNLQIQTDNNFDNKHLPASPPPRLPHRRAGGLVACSGTKPPAVVPSGRSLRHVLVRPLPAVGGVGWRLTGQSAPIWAPFGRPLVLRCVRGLTRPPDSRRSEPPRSSAPSRKKKNHDLGRASPEPSAASKADSTAARGRPTLFFSSFFFAASCSNCC